LGLVKKDALHNGHGQHMQELRDELRARLRTAEAVEEKMVAMRQQYSSSLSSPSDEETYLKHSEP